MNAQIAYPEYDALRVVERREIIGITLDGWKVRHQITVFDFNKPPIDAANPDATIAPDYKRPRKKHVATETLLADIRTLLLDKPMTAREMAEVLDSRPHLVGKALLHHPDGFVVLAKGLTGHVWGVEGVEYPPVHTGAIGQIVNYLREHGASTAREICEAIGMGNSTFYSAHERSPGVLRCTEVRRSDNAHGGLVQVWEIA